MRKLIVRARRALPLLLCISIAGCASKISHDSVKLSNGQIVDYVVGKVAGDGQEGVFRDAFVDGKPVLSHFGSGQSLTGQVLQGTASSAMIAGGMVGAAAVLRPTRINNHETNNLDNQQVQGQSQSQDATSVSVSSSDARASNRNTNSSSSTAVNSNHNHNKIKVYDIGGGNDGCANSSKNGECNPGKGGGQQ